MHNRDLVVSALLGGLALCYMPPIYAANIDNQQTSNTTQSVTSYAATKLIGKSVKNRTGDKLGEIKELVFTSDGKLEYVVLGVGGFLGLNQSLVPVPISRLQLMPGETPARLNATEQDLKNAPSIARDNWAISEQQWRSSANAYFQTRGASMASTNVVDFKKLDVNSNGAISTQEAQRAPTLSENFERFDADQDGQLNSSEFSVFEEAFGAIPAQDDPKTAPQSAQ